MKVLLTGAGGFLGKAILEKLVKREQVEIFVLTSKVKPLLEKYCDNERVHIVENCKYEMLDYSTIDFLISCAFPTNAEDGVAMAQGMEYVCKLLNYANAQGVKHIVDISTQSVYGLQRQQKADELTKINLDTKYAAGKYYTEIMLNAICHNCLVTHYRIASLIGPGYEQRITNRMIQSLIKGEPLLVVDSNQVMGYMDVRDAADAIVCSLFRLDASCDNEVYNIAGDAYSLSEIVETIVEVGKEYHVHAKEITYKETGMYRNTGVDSTKFTAKFDWHPKYELKDMVCEIFKQKLLEMK